MILFFLLFYLFSFCICLAFTFLFCLSFHYFFFTFTFPSYLYIDLIQTPYWIMIVLKLKIITVWSEAFKAFVDQLSDVEFIVDFTYVFQTFECDLLVGFHSHLMPWFDRNNFVIVLCDCHYLSSFFSLFFLLLCIWDRSNNIICFFFRLLFCVLHACVWVFTIVAQFHFSV